MTVAHKRRFRVVLIALAALALLAVFGPKPSAEGFRAQVEASLERALQRDVEIEGLEFTLWGGPGFTLSNVVISDRVEVSAEPFAYVSEARASLQLSSIWRAEILFSRITLVQPSVNIAELPGGGYNFEQMLRRGVGAGKQAAGSLPEIVVEGARINFRKGLQKSVYYFRNADLKILEEGSGGNSWMVEFRAEPGRTDSYAPRFGTVRASGRWRPEAGQNGEFDMDVEIERSPFAEIASLFRASRVGLSGYLTARAHLSGPAENVDIRGRLELDEGSASTIPFVAAQAAGVALRGSLNVIAHRLHVETSIAEDAVPRFSASLDLNPEVAPGEWHSALAFDELPVERVIHLLQYLDGSFPDYPQLRGAVSGEVGYQSDSGLRGHVSGAQLSWQEGDTPSFRLGAVEIGLHGDSLSGRGLLHSGDSVVEEIAAEVEPSFSFAIDRRSGAITTTIEGNQIGPAYLDLLRRIAPVLSHRPPLLEGSRWRASGKATWHRPNFRAPGLWAGTLLVTNLTLPVDGFRSPVVLRSASLTVHGNLWRLSNARARLGEMEFSLDASFTPDARRPWELTLRANQIALNQLAEELILDSQEDRGFLHRTFSLGRASLPVWLRTRALSAKVYIEKVLIEDSNYRNVTGDLYWDGTVLEFRNISAQSRFGPLRAQVRGDLSGSTPGWRWNFQALDPSVAGGELRLEASQSATGGLAEIPDRIAGTGELTWRRRSRDAESAATLFRLNLQWLPGEDEPRICPGCVELRNPSGVWLGSCNQSNGTGYHCYLEDPRTGQKLETNLPISLLGQPQN